MRTFGHKRPVRDQAGAVIAQVPSPVAAMTRDELGGQFGKDRRRRLAVTLADGDVIVMRPTGTRREVSATAQDIYRFMIRVTTGRYDARVRELKKVMTLAEARRQARKERGW